MITYWIIIAAIVMGAILLNALGVLRFRTDLPWSAWVVVGLVLLNGGWMAFDGGRALWMGDYVTPPEGPMAGLLGPWSKVVEAVGIAPRSTLMKSIFLAYGLAYVAATAAFVFGARWAWSRVSVLAILGFWYVPFGTILNLAVLVLMLTPALRRVGDTH